MPNDLPDWVTNVSLPGATINVPQGSAQVSQNVVLPTRAPAVIVDFLTTQVTTVQVVGHTSAETYLNLVGIQPPGPKAAIVTDGRDASVDVLVAHNQTQADTVDVSFIPNASIAMLAAGSVTDVSDRANRSLGTIASVGGTVTTLAAPTPALWQAPTASAQAQPSAVGNTVMVAGVANQRIRVFGWELETDQGTGFSIAFLNDSDALAAGRLAALTANNGQISGSFQGFPLGVGKGLILEVAAIAAGGNVRAFVGYSQG
jgi:hypothetical protein